MLSSDWCTQVDALVHRTSQTLQLLIEYDPVRQRLDRLRLGSPLDQLGVPATGRMRLSSPSNAVLERPDVVDNSTLKRRSLRCVGRPASQPALLWGLSGRLALLNQLRSRQGPNVL